ncbi:ATP-dependent DNA helicase mer3 homolog, partial [Plakobranchus ocellatus]
MNIGKRSIYTSTSDSKDEAMEMIMNGIGKEDGEGVFMNDDYCAGCGTVGGVDPQLNSFCQTATHIYLILLHKNLIEHLNAEIVLQTISDMSLVVEWIRHTFLYVRVMKNPRYYGLPSNLSTQEVEEKLQDLCLQNVTHLTSQNLVSINNEAGTIWPTGKIKTKQVKVNCLIQAQLGCLPIQDFSLSQDMAKIFRVGQRVAKCLMEFMYHGNSYLVLMHAILVYKAFKTKIWFDSRYVARQLDGIGPTMSLALANAGLSTFQKLEQAHPRDIEVIVNRHPPFGNQIKESLAKLPRYELAIEQVKCYKPHKSVIVLSVDLMNRGAFETIPSSQITHQSILLIGDADNKIVFKWRIFDAVIFRDGMLTRTVEVHRTSKGKKLDISLLSQDTDTSSLKKDQSSCNHKCLNKSTCGHKCCKINNTGKRPSAGSTLQSKSKMAKVEKPLYRGSKDMKDILSIFDRQQSGT